MRSDVTAGCEKRKREWYVVKEMITEVVKEEIPEEPSVEVTTLEKDESQKSESSEEWRRESEIAPPTVPLSVSPEFQPLYELCRHD